MKYINKLNIALILGLITTTFIFTIPAFANETIFAALVPDSQIIVTASVENTNPNIYVTCNKETYLMSEFSDSSNKIRVLPMGHHLSVLGAENGWVKVSDDDGQIGYVHSSSVTFNNGTKPQNIAPIEKKGNEIVAFSKNYLGTPYVWGGTSLTSGVDCSGFVYSVYKNFGITLNRSSSAMYSGNGVAVSKSDLKAGDLLFFNTSGSGVSHVGMYIGNGQYIHSADTCVKISDLSSSYSQRTYIGAKRILA